ncbi:hypothetical protein L1286_19925 [Pseudoalteromonas sp. SMS1]|uniref:LuxR C-terminal-related transcriptional regulator n=1 Tax=Pseudoalteromonas sp. SMS1 TaxID=2908894 RepID=UPI001F2EA201|nr:hypothetical protein [Pseudoalteromonas sp. SMS1]MCF2859753.1 hypothetical protein [Pseudoalteromonas sp. SMS1]
MTRLYSRQAMPHNTIYTLSDALDSKAKQWLNDQEWSVQHYTKRQTFFAQADLSLPTCVVLQLNNSVHHYAALYRQLTDSNSPIQPVILESPKTLFPQKYNYLSTSLNFVALPVEVASLSQLVNHALEAAAEKQQSIRMLRVYCDVFTARELAIAHHLANGKIAHEIAQCLQLPSITIEKYLMRMAEKTACQTPAALIQLLAKYPPKWGLPPHQDR